MIDHCLEKANQKYYKNLVKVLKNSLQFVNKKKRDSSAGSVLHVRVRFHFKNRIKKRVVVSGSSDLEHVQVWVPWHFSKGRGPRDASSLPKSLVAVAELRGDVAPPGSGLVASTWWRQSLDHRRDVGTRVQIEPARA